MTKVQLTTRQTDFRVDDGRSGFLMCRATLGCIGRDSPKQKYDCK